jgi:hypothetical protein
MTPKEGGCRIKSGIGEKAFPHDPNPVTPDLIRGPPSLLCASASFMKIVTVTLFRSGHKVTGAYLAKRVTVTDFETLKRVTVTLFMRFGQADR